MKAVISDDEYRMLRYYAGDPDVATLELTDNASIRYGLVAKHLRTRGWLQPTDEYVVFVGGESAPCLSPAGWRVLRAAIAARKGLPSTVPLISVDSTQGTTW
jgi:hypothetical protein